MIILTIVKSAVFAGEIDDIQLLIQLYIEYSAC